MTIDLREATASQEIPLGPFLDSTDGDTEESGLTIANTDIKLWKAGATTLASKNSGGGTYISNGVYYAVLDATDTNTPGALVVYVHVSGALACKQECRVLPANIYDSLYSTDKLQVDCVQIGGDTQSATDLKDFADAGYDPATNKVQGVVLTDTCTTLTGHTAQTGDSFAIVNGDHGLVSIQDDVDAILADTNELQTNQGNWATATGFMPSTEDGSSFTALPAVTLANGAHGGAAASITLASYSDFTGAAAANPNVLQDGTITVTTQTEFTLSAGSADDDAYNNMVIVFEDASTATQKSVRTITDYVGATKTVTINSAPDFTIVTTDNFNILAVAPGSTPPTAGQVADAVWDEAIADHTTSTTFGGKNQKAVPSETVADYKATGFATPTNITAGTITTVSGNVDGSVGSVTGAVGSVTEKTGFSLAADQSTVTIGTVTTNTDMRGTDNAALASVCTESRLAELDAANLPTDISSLNDITVAEIIAGVADGSYDLQEMLRLIFAATVGKVSGGGTTTLSFRDSADSKNRIVATVDANGNRTAMTLDAS